MKKFRERFHFDEAKTLFVGVEREFFIGNALGAIVPEAPRVIKGLMEYADPENFWSGDGYYYLPSQYSYELSACQLETKIGPVPIGQLPDALQLSEETLIRKEEQHDFRRLYTEVAPDTIPLDVYPDPTGRYARITQNMPTNVLRAACQIIGTHIHIGMPNHDTALRVYNRVIESCPRLCATGDHSHGKRLSIYRTMAPNCDPLPYKDWEAFHATARERGFDTDPRSCWTLIRISIHGTIEFRMFGTTQSLKTIADWAQRCYDLCQLALW